MTAPAGAGGAPRRRAARVRRALALLALAAGLAPAVARAWPAIQEGSGAVFLCDSRPESLSDGQWRCRSAGGDAVGGLVEVVRPGVPPGARPFGGPPGPPSRFGYGFVPWGPPAREPSGYDALDPWLGHGGSAR